MKRIGQILALVFLFTGNTWFLAQAETMRTISLAPVDVRTEVKGFLLNGKAWIKSVEPQMIQKVIFQVFDNYDAEIVSREIEWNEKFLVSDKKWATPQIVVPFSYDFESQKLSGNFELRALVQDTKGKIIARGARLFVFDVSEPTTKIADLQLETGESGKARFTVFYEGKDGKHVQPEVTIRMQPQIDIFEHASGGTLISSQKGALQEIHGHTAQAIDIPFEIPNVPETYVVEVRLLDQEGNHLTGTLKQRLLVDGDFGEITFFDAQSKRFLEAGETQTFSFHGIARRNPNPLTFVLQVDQLFQGKVVETFRQEKDLHTATNPEFNEDFLVTISERGADEFRVRAQLLRDGYLIESKSFTTEAYLKSDSKIYQVYHGMLSDNLHWYLMGFVGVLILLFLFFKFRISKPPLSLLVLVFSMGIGLSGTTQAAWINSWEYPESDWGYNPKNTTGFQTIRFKGTVQDDVTSQGLFSSWGGIPDTLEIHWSDSNDTKTTIDTTEARFGNSEYEFEFDIPEALSDGKYTPQIHFAKDGTTLDTSWEGIIKIDTTAPSALKFSYSSSSWTNAPVEISIQCEDDFAGCFPSTIEPFDVKGNFCSDASTCNTSGARGFEICDQVGNCSDYRSKQVEIDFYDPEAPSLGGVTLAEQDSDTTLAATDTFSFEILTPKDASESSESFDTHACGTEGNDDVYLKEDRCATSSLPCALSAVEHGSYNQEAGESCTFKPLPEATCSPFSFPLCIPFEVGG